MPAAIAAIVSCEFNQSLVELAHTVSFKDYYLNAGPSNAVSHKLYLFLLPESDIL
ncbi:MAG TPA: hypothetical protein VN207_10220 [Ktedonobacteraceae bacterium]|nr:hypothetical protein [Ktedonobacteraceae bacterium]